MLTLWWRCVRGKLSVYDSTSGKKKLNSEVAERPSLSVTHTLSHSHASSVSLFHLSELMNRCCRAVECRMMDCASGGRSQLGKERERDRAREFYDFSAIQTIVFNVFKGTVHQRKKKSPSCHSKLNWVFFLLCTHNFAVEEYSVHLFPYFELNWNESELSDSTINYCKSRLVAKTRPRPRPSRDRREKNNRLVLLKLSNC